MPRLGIGKSLQRTPGESRPNDALLRGDADQGEDVLGAFAEVERAIPLGLDREIDAGAPFFPFNGDDLMHVDVHLVAAHIGNANKSHDLFQSQLLPASIVIDVPLGNRIIPRCRVVFKAGILCS